MVYGVPSQLCGLVPTASVTPFIVLRRFPRRIVLISALTCSCSNTVAHRTPHLIHFL